MNPVETSIQGKLQQFNPSHLDVVNESHRHNVPQGSESHFKVTVVSNDFSGIPLLARHRMVNEKLKEELDGTVHALAVHTYTPEEWLEQSAHSPDSPDCLGGNKL